MFHSDCLKYAHENGSEWDENTCNVSAYGGHLNCLKYAHENGCNWISKRKENQWLPFDCEDNACAISAEKGHLDTNKDVFTHLYGAPETSSRRCFIVTV